jgi:glycerol-3-phosphate dehydrogenase
MWQKSWRDQVWSQLDTDWDMIVVGGGITGAGILKEATQSGYKVLLVEALDFSSGTSSRSSKLVHGGMRYLANGQFKVTYESVREREHLLRDGKGLVNKLDILMSSVPKDKTPGWQLGLGLLIYSAMAGKWHYGHYNPKELESKCPNLTIPHLKGAYQYYDAATDDSRLTLRIIREAVAAGGTALNYARAIDLCRDQRGKVCGVVVEDQVGEGRTIEVKTSLVINATGAWVDDLRGKLGRKRRIRPLQGSHLLLPFERLPLEQSVSVFHPDDGRPVFTVPWEGVTLIGTTDIDVGCSLQANPPIEEEEVEYLLKLVQYAFPAQELKREDILCTLSGIRPVIDTGKADPSKESREYAVWLEDGLLTITGGKLTTFRLMARDVLKAAHRLLPQRHKFNPNLPLFDFCGDIFGDLTYSTLDPETLVRLAGRYGIDSPKIFSVANPGELENIEGTQYLWSELRWAAREEGVVHLDDLLLRRVRLGLLLPNGARHQLGRIREIAQSELGWDDQRWQQEEDQYLQLWEKSYKVR